MYDGQVVFVHDTPTGHTWPNNIGQTDEVNRPFLLKAQAVFQVEGKNLPCRESVER